MNIHMASVSSLTASLKNGFRLGTDARLSGLREILIQDQEDGNPPYVILNCDCTDRRKIHQINATSLLQPWKILWI